MNSEDFTDGQPFTVDAEDIARPWGGRGFTCGWCSKPFQVGDVARWQSCPSAPNLFVCVEHDGDGLVELWTARFETAVAEARRFGFIP